MTSQSEQTLSSERVLRVFVSSTFQDMHEEREELVKRVFPQLRKLCEARGVTWGEVDLRWGISDEQLAEGKVLPLCLEEVRRCRPYFIGLLGERYGWIPDEIPQELIEAQPWLNENLEHSVTELEILHGVLNNRDMADHAFFYLRDERYLDSLPDSRQKAFSEQPREEEIDRYGLEEAKKRAERRQRKLTDLKNRIRASGLPVREDYRDPQELAAWVLRDLTAVIDLLYPEQDKPNPLDRESDEHEAFARRRVKVYVGRKEYFDQLDAHVEGEGPPLVVLGESGTGKSALLSNWALQYRKEHPGELVLMHFIGASSYSADWGAMLRRILGEFGRVFEEDVEIPVQPEALREAFADMLGRVATQGRVVLILDALNQLEDRDRAPDLIWLPPVIPPNIRLILSSLPGRSLEELQKRNWPQLTIESLETEERGLLIDKYLAQFAKKLSPGLTSRIVSAEQSANPLFVRALLEELRVFGVHEQLEERLDFYLFAKTLPDLYQRILQRYEEDYDPPDRPDLVRDAMSLLWAGRRGLSEAELRDLMGKEGEPLARAYWSPLFLAAEESLVERSGLIGFFHDYLRQAVQERYLPSTASKEESHLRLADYFTKQEAGTRKEEELPWQLMQAGAWERLKECISDMEMFLPLMTEEKKYELMGYWLAIGDRFDMVQAYGESLERHEMAGVSEAELANMLNWVAMFLSLTAQFEGAEPLYRRTLAIREKVLGAEHPETAISLVNLAGLLKDKGNYEGAEPLYRQALAITEKVLGPEHPDTAISLTGLATLLHTTGDYEGAEPLYQRTLPLVEKLRGPEHPETATSLGNLARLLQIKGDLEGAEPLFRRALGIAEKVRGPEHRDTAYSLSHLASLLEAKGDYKGAEPFYRRSLAIDERVLGPEHPDTATCLGNLASLLNAKGDYEGAEPLYRRSLAIREKVLGPEHPTTANNLNNLALLLQDKGDFEGAEPLFRRSLAIDEKVLGPEHSETATSLNNLAGLLYTTGNYEGAEPLFRQASAITEKVLGPEHPNTAASLRNLASLLQAKGDFQGAEPLFKRSLAIDEKVLGPEHSETAASLNNLASLLQAKGDFQGAEPLFRRALAIREKVLGPEHPDTAASLNNLASLLQAKGDFQGAEPLFRRALAIREKKLGPEHPDTAVSLNILAGLLQDKGDYEGAEPLFRQALAIREKVLGPEHPKTATSLNNLASLLNAKGDYEGTEPLFRQALATNEQQLGPEHPDTANSLINLAGLLQAKGDYEGAEPLVRQALAINEKQLGPEHTDTATSLNNLAGLLTAKGDYEGAEPLFRQALAIDEKVLGPEHPYTAIIANNLAALLEAKGDL